MRLLADGAPVAADGDSTLSTQISSANVSDYSRQQQAGLVRGLVEGSFSSMEMARPLSPRKPLRLRKSLEQQHLLAECGMQIPLPSDQHSPAGYVAAPGSHEQAESCPFHFAQNNRYSQTSTPDFHSRRASTASRPSLPESYAARNSTSIRACITGNLVRQSVETVHKASVLRGRGDTEDPSDLSGFQLKAKKAFTMTVLKQAPQASGQPERRRSRLGASRIGSGSDVEQRDPVKALSRSPSCTASQAFSLGSLCSLSSLARTADSMTEMSTDWSDASSGVRCISSHMIGRAPDGKLSGSVGKQLLEHALNSLKNGAADLIVSRSACSAHTRTAIQSLQCPSIEFSQLHMCRKIGNGSMGQVNGALQDKPPA